MGVEYDVGQRDEHKSQVEVTKVTRVGDCTPFLGYKVDVLHDAPRKDYDQISDDDNGWVFSEEGDTFQLRFTSTIRHLLKAKSEKSLLK